MTTQRDSGPTAAPTTRTVLVTGGTGGLGQAVTAAFLAAGWRTVVTTRRHAADPSLANATGRPVTGATDRTPSPAIAGMAGGGSHDAGGPAGGGPGGVVALVPGHGSGAVPAREILVPSDLTDPDSAASAVAVAAGDPAAPLRAVVNLVGGYAAGGLVHETPVAEFERMLTLNLRPTFLVTAAALPHLVAAGGGSVVCVSSRAAVAPFAGAAGYVTAKAAVTAFANAVAVEYRAHGVRCNTVLPSVIDTPANRAAQPAADHSRWVPPAKIAQVVLFLSGDESAPVTGASIPV